MYLNNNQAKVFDLKTADEYEVQDFSVQTKRKREEEMEETAEKQTVDNCK